MKELQGLVARMCERMRCTCEVVHADPPLGAPAGKYVRLIFDSDCPEHGKEAVPHV